MTTECRCHGAWYQLEEVPKALSQASTGKLVFKEAPPHLLPITAKRSQTLVQVERLKTGRLNIRSGLMA